MDNSPAPKQNGVALSDYELRIEAARWDKLVSKYLGWFSPVQRRQVSTQLIAWANRVTNAGRIVKHPDSIGHVPRGNGRLHL
jgi:hypothetical protein